MGNLIGVLFDGVAYGSLLFLISVGLSVTMGLMNFINLAHGAFAMLGGFVCVTLLSRLGLPFLLTLPLAFAVNTAGLAVCVSLPFLLGQRMGVDVQGALLRRWPQLARLGELERESAFHLLALVRAMGLLPCDAVSLWFGASGMRYGPYLAGSLAGMLPMMLAETALGAAVQEAGSWQFWTAAGCGAVLAVLSLLLGYRMWKRER